MASLREGPFGWHFMAGFEGWHAARMPLQGGAWPEENGCWAEPPLSAPYIPGCCGGCPELLCWMVFPRQFCCSLCCKLLLLIINKMLKSCVLLSLGHESGSGKGSGPQLGSLLQLLFPGALTGAGEWLQWLRKEFVAFGQPNLCFGPSWAWTGTEVRDHSWLEAICCTVGEGLC